jgi:hypothetical protein
MQTLKEVEAARTLMREAAHWSVMRWLAEKKRVRKAADRANDALDELNRQIKAEWPEALKAAYAEVSKNHHGARTPSDNGLNPEILKLAKRVRQADNEAYSARMEAEKTFDLAEKRLSTSMAREGTHQAITSWDLHEKAIALAVAGSGANKAAS